MVELDIPGQDGMKLLGENIGNVQCSGQDTSRNIFTREKAYCG